MLLNFSSFYGVSLANFIILFAYQILLTHKGHNSICCSTIQYYIWVNQMENHTVKKRDFCRKSTLKYQLSSLKSTDHLVSGSLITKVSLYRNTGIWEMVGWMVGVILPFSYGLTLLRECLLV